MAVDLGRKRLLVAELGNDSVDLVDLISGKAVHRITGLREPQGIAYLPGPDLILVASAGDGSVRLFKGEDGAPAGVIDLGDDADDVRVDPGTGHAIVGYGEGGLATIDAATRRKVADMKLQAHPEGFQLDPKGRRIFANVPDAKQIAVVDLATGGQVATWVVPNLGSNFPMAIDDAGTVLATVFRDPARLVLLDTSRGLVGASLDTCGDADDVFFDTKRQRIYVSCGAGKVDVFQKEGAGYRLASRVDTSAGARTSLFVPQLDRLYVAARADLLGLSSAAILVLRPEP
jgi:DNA-binding beta-propeller fold protein YncE